MGSSNITFGWFWHSSKTLQNRTVLSCLWGNGALGTMHRGPQNNGHDCGVFTILNLEAFLMDKDRTAWSSKAVTKARRVIVGRIFEKAKKDFQCKTTKASLQTKTSQNCMLGGKCSIASHNTFSVTQERCQN